MHTKTYTTSPILFSELKYNFILFNYLFNSINRPAFQVSYIL